MDEKDELYRIAQELEAFLPGWSLSWDPGERPRFALFEGPDGAGFYVELDRRTNPARLAVHGRYPAPYCPDPARRPRITVGSARPVEAIAANVQRRFLPAYLALYAQLRERRQRAEELERRDAAIRADLAAILGERVGDDGVIRYSNSGGKPVGSRYIYGRIDVSGEEVRLDLSGVPVETARAVCRLLVETSARASGERLD
ncbi:MAG: hypothetical protein JXD18_12020 [Anaerolineae bacterium]|nr:hypothetical protein [Anaerolineae bacterium]